MKEQYIEVREDTQRLHKFGRRIWFRESLEVYDNATVNYAIDHKLFFFSCHGMNCQSRLDDTRSLLNYSKLDGTSSLLSSDRGWPWG